MKKSDIFIVIAQKYSLPKYYAEKIVNIIFKEIAEALAQGKRVEIRSLGSFSTRQREAKIGHNPKTGAIINIEAQRVPFFKACKNLRTSVSQGKK